MLDGKTPCRAWTPPVNREPVRNKAWLETRTVAALTEPAAWRVATPAIGKGCGPAF